MLIDLFWFDPGFEDDDGDNGFRDECSEKSSDPIFLNIFAI